MQADRAFTSDRTGAQSRGDYHRHRPDAGASRGGFVAFRDVSDSDALTVLIFSVGGGDAEHNVSTNLVSAIDRAKKRAAKVFEIVGKDTGHTARHGDVVVVIPQVNPAWITPLSEAFRRWSGIASSRIRSCRKNDQVVNGS